MRDHRSFWWTRGGIKQLKNSETFPPYSFPASDVVFLYSLLTSSLTMLFSSGSRAAETPSFWAKASTAERQHTVSDASV